MDNTKIRIFQYCDGFGIEINTKDDEYRFVFGQEDTVSDLVDVFNSLGFKKVTYEDVM